MDAPQNLSEFDDVQGNILTKYDAGFATYLFYRVDLADQARLWLEGLLPRVTTEKGYCKESPSTLNIAITYQGFRALGLSPTSLNSFPVEFQEGMRKRAATLCDFGESAPQHWDAPLGSPQVHLLVLVHGKSAESCKKLADEVQGTVPKVGENSVGVHLLARMEAEGLDGNKEHFGFKDGISQPWIEGTEPGLPVQPYGGKRVKSADGNATLQNSFAPLRMGEFLLGHKDELDRLPPAPLPAVLGANGSYLVFRKLYQDVPAFKAEMAKQAKYVFGDPSEKDRLAANIIGRWPSGCPVDLSPEHDDQQYATDEKVNAFAFENDGDGMRCPVSSHIRRTNPRDLKLDAQGNLVVEPMSTRHRMIRRSLPYGPAVGKNEDDSKKTDRGLMFVALVADIERQFEFVQRNWINTGDPFRLDSRDRDPLAGSNRDARDVPSQDTYLMYSDLLVRTLTGMGITGKVTNVAATTTAVDLRYVPSPETTIGSDNGLRDRLASAFKVDRVEISPPDTAGAVTITVPTFPETKRSFSLPSATRLPWALNLPEFVNTRGGEYFFLPSPTALKGLVSLGFSSFRKEYAEVEKTIQDPAVRSRMLSDLIRSWLILRPKEMLDELRKMAEEENKIFTMEGYTVFGNPLYTTSPPIAIVTKYDDVCEVLDWIKHKQSFTVKLYRNQMEVPPPRPSRGQFILGKDLDDPLYIRELPALVGAVRATPESQSEPELLEMIAKIVDSIFDDITKRKTGKLDVIQDLAWPIPLGINAKYFGVPGPDPDTFKRWLRHIYRDLFLNLRGNVEWSKLADIAVSEMNPYLDGLIQDYDMRQESVLKQLILANKAATPPFEANFVRRNIMGLTVGVVETTLKAIARTIDQFLRRPQQLEQAQKAAAKNDKDTVLKYAYEAMRFNPQNHVLFRLCAKDTTIAAGTPRETTIRRGTIVFVATLPAMFDQDGPFKRPNEFSTDRQLKDYLFFGYAAHECMGRYLMPMVFKELFVRLLQLKGLKRAKDDEFDPLDLFPEHLKLEFQP